MGPWSSGKKTTNGNEDTVAHRQGAAPRQGPGRPSRGPTGHGRSNTRPQDGMSREYEDRGQQARQVAREEGQPQGRAVARSHGRPVHKRPGAGPPEGSTSQHVLQGPRQTSVLPPAPASVRHHSAHNERIRTLSNSNDPRRADTMRSRRDNSPVKNVHNVRAIQNTVGSMGNHSRSIGRGGIQPGPVSARAGVPRPSRPPAPSHPLSVPGRTPGPSQEHRPSAQHRDQPVTSASTDRDTSTLIDDGARSGQQIVTNPKHKGQNRSYNQSQNQNNQNTAASSSRASNTPRINNTATNDQPRLPNSQSSRTDANSVCGTSRQIVQKPGKNNNPGRIINIEPHSGQRTNNVLVEPDITRLSSCSSDGDNNAEGASVSNARNKQKNKTAKGERIKPENANTRTMTGNSAEGANRGNRERNIESGVFALGSNTRRNLLSSNNPSTNVDNARAQQVQRTSDNSGDNRPVQNPQVLKQKPTQHVRTHQQRPGQSSTGNCAENMGSADRSNGHSADTTVVRNLRTNSSTDSTAGVNESTGDRRSVEGQLVNTPTEGPREGPGASEQNDLNTIVKPVSKMNKANTALNRQQPVPVGDSSSSSRDRSEHVQRSDHISAALNEGSGARNQRPSEDDEPSSQATARNKPVSANAQSNTTATNNTSDSANTAAASQRRTEMPGVNGPRNNQTSGQNRTPVQNSNARSQNDRARPVNTPGNNRSATCTRASNTGNSGQVRTVVQGNSANNTGARASNPYRSNMSSTVTAPVGNSGPSQQRRLQSGAVLDPNQLSVDIIENSVSDQPPPYSTLDNSRSNRRNHRGNRGNSPGQALPDILNSHVHSPRQNESRSNRRGANPQQNGGARRNRGVTGRRPPRGTTRLDSTSSSWEGCTKWGCLRCLTIITTFRWILITLALLGVCCVLTGIVLGALHMTIGSSFLILSLMFIGLGVMLVIVVGVGWKCTPRGHEPCHLLFNLGDHSTAWNGINLESAPRSRSNPRNQWVGGTIYDEFQYRRPPPSYNASMHEYQQQIALAQLRNSRLQNNDNTPNSPPPTYKSHASAVRPGLHITFPVLQDDEYPSSRPPTYRSTAGTLNRPRINTNPDENEQQRTEGANNRETEMSQEQIMNERNSNQSRPETPSSPSLTLQRANQVVNYLDNVLDDSIREMERANIDNTQEQLQGNEQNNGYIAEESGTTDRENEAHTANNDARDAETTRDSSSTLSERRNSTSTSTTTSSSNRSSGSASGGDTIVSSHNNCSEGSNRNSSSEASCRNSSSEGSSRNSSSEASCRNSSSEASCRNTSSEASSRNSSSEASSRNSSSSQNSGDNSHIVADTHL